MQIIINITRANSPVKPHQDDDVDVLDVLDEGYHLVVWNDDVNTFDHVIRTILELTPLGEQEAVERTIEAHETGVSLLLVTHQERAELYVEQFASKGLTVTCEPDA